MYGYYIVWKFGEYSNNRQHIVYRTAEKAVKAFKWEIMAAIEASRLNGFYVYVDVFPELQMVKITEKYHTEDKEGQVSCCILCKTLIEPGMPMAIEDEDGEEDEDD